MGTIGGLLAEKLPDSKVRVIRDGVVIYDGELVLETL